MTIYREKFWFLLIELFFKMTSVLLRLGSKHQPQSGRSAAVFPEECCRLGAWLTLGARAPPRHCITGSTRPDWGPVPSRHVGKTSVQGSGSLLRHCPARWGQAGWFGQGRAPMRRLLAGQPYAQLPLPFSTLLTLFRVRGAVSVSLCDGKGHDCLLVHLTV